MKDLKHIRRFNESEENLNISDVSDLFSNKKLKRLFFDTFSSIDSEVDIHKNNHDYDIFIDNGLLRNAGFSTSDRIVLRLTSKGKNIVKENNH
jgi:hypothetical protein